MSGPTVTPGWSPGPCLISPTLAASLAAKASYTPSCTRMRLAQTHVWPLFRNLEPIAPATASSKSASSKTMSGACPPSSMLTFLTVAADWRSSCLPTAVEPVKPSLRTVGLEQSSSPTSCAFAPSTRLSTPLGIPARSASSASALAEKGVSSDGLTTTGQPTARAGAHLRVIIADGKFHGVIAPTTPTGCLRTRMRVPGVVFGTTSP
mmetsp:Transcript_21482/g.63310  ORF Transcript_21482/g.63310 Transcript_21482/m.63310 type:complete len:207 (-) Transcript_21482:550-1170(-)